MTSAKVLTAGAIFLTTALASIIATAPSRAVAESQAVALVATATAPCGKTSSTVLATSPRLASRSGHSIRLGRFDGIVYYTVEQDGYRVVATLASGAEGLPIRFVSTLGPGQRIIISTPQSVNEPAIEVEILRDGDALLVSDLVPRTTADLGDAVATEVALCQ
jgi:hypothetical protein